MAHQSSYFARNMRSLIIASTVYVVGLIVTHASFPVIYVWSIAAFFSIAMNFTYLIEARSIKQFVRVETLVSILLIALTVIGFTTDPRLIILAIFGHGCWDLLKHQGAGVRFFSWYTLGCAAVDWLYSSALLWYWLTTN